MSFLRDLVHEVRRFIPLPVLLAVARRRVRSLWQDPAYRAAQEANVRFLLEHTSRFQEIPALAREYAEFDVLRNYRRWRPQHLLRQPVHGIEWLTARRDPARGVVLSFMHHGQYDGLVASLANAGVCVQPLVAPDAFDPAAPVQIRQHYKLSSGVPGSTLVNAGDGSARLVEVLAGGEILVVASDVAGRTPVIFMGREILGSFGAARVATETDSPVVLVTSHRDAEGRSYFQLHEPLEPSDFADPGDLLSQIFKLHEPAVLAWPAAYDSPLGRLETSSLG